MDHKERLFTALEHREPDQVPLDIGGFSTSGITCDVYSELARYLGLIDKEEEVEVAYDIQRLAKLDEKFLNRFGVDIRGISPNLSFTESETHNHVDLVDIWGITWKCSKKPDAMFYVAENPFLETENPEEIEDYNWPDPNGPFFTKGLKQRAKKYWENGFPVTINHWCMGILEMSQALRGHEKLYKDIVKRPDMAEAIMDKILELKKEFWGNLLSKMPDIPLVVKQNDDLGGQRNPLISPAMYRQYLKPRHSELFNFIKSVTGKPTYLLFHSDGAIYPLIEDFIDAGIDILNPVQVTAKGMDPQRLKRNFGDRLVFWGGGISVQKTLYNGNRDDIRQEVKSRIKQFASGGGFVFAPSHDIGPNVPAENVITTLEAFSEYKNYK